MTRSRRLAYLALLGTALIWGAALPIVKPALSHLTPYNFLLLRYLVAAWLMAPIVVFAWPKRFHFKDALIVGVLEFIQIGLGLTALYVGLSLTSSLSAGVIGTISPFLVVLGGIFFLKEREERREWVGLGISVLGTLVIVFSSFILTGNQGANSHLGNMLVFLNDIFYVIYLLLAKKLYHYPHKLHLSALNAFVGLVSFMIIAPMFGPLVPFSTIIHQPAILTAVLYMGILGSPVAIALLLYGQSHVEASEAALFTYLQPLAYIPLSIIWLGDRLFLPHLVGLLLIALGVILAESRSRRPKVKF